MSQTTTTKNDLTYKPIIEAMIYEINSTNFNQATTVIIDSFDSLVNYIKIYLYQTYIRDHCKVTSDKFTYDINAFNQFEFKSYPIIKSSKKSITSKEYNDITKIINEKLNSLWEEYTSNKLIPIHPNFDEQIVEGDITQEEYDINPSAYKKTSKQVAEIIFGENFIQKSNMISKHASSLKMIVTRICSNCIRELIGDKVEQNLKFCNIVVDQDKKGFIHINVSNENKFKEHLEQIVDNQFDKIKNQQKTEIKAPQILTMTAFEKLFSYATEEPKTSTNTFNINRIITSFTSQLDKEKTAIGQVVKNKSIEATNTHYLYFLKETLPSICSWIYNSIKRYYYSPKSIIEIFELKELEIIEDIQISVKKVITYANKVEKTESIENKPKKRGKASITDQLQDMINEVKNNQNEENKPKRSRSKKQQEVPNVAEDPIVQQTTETPKPKRGRKTKTEQEQINLSNVDEEEQPQVELVASNINIDKNEEMTTPSKKTKKTPQSNKVVDTPNFEQVITPSRRKRTPKVIEEDDEEI